jgi:hypothetical protein
VATMRPRLFAPEIIRTSSSDGGRERADGRHRGHLGQWRI